MGDCAALHKRAVARQELILALSNVRLHEGVVRLAVRIDWKHYVLTFHPLAVKLVAVIVNLCLFRNGHSEELQNTSPIFAILQVQPFHIVCENTLVGVVKSIENGNI